MEAIEKSREQFTQLKVDELNIEEFNRGINYIELEREYPYDKFSTILNILDSAPNGISMENLNPLIYELQENHCFPLNYLFVDDRPRGLKEDLRILIDFGFIESLGSVHTLTQEGVRATKIIRNKIRRNPLEEFMELATYDAVHIVASRFI